MCQLATAAADSAECSSLKSELRTTQRELADTKAKLTAALEEIAFLRKVRGAIHFCCRVIEQHAS